MMKLYEFETNFSTHIFCFLARVRTLSFLYGRLMSFFFLVCKESLNPGWLSEQKIVTVCNFGWLFGFLRMSSFPQQAYSSSIGSFVSLTTRSRAG